jgi:hypothetical protein
MKFGPLQRRSTSFMLCPGRADKKSSDALGCIRRYPEVSGSTREYHRTQTEQTRMNPDMSNAIQNLLDKVNSLPEQGPRSKLEPYYEVIRALRKKRYTYQEIAQFLASEAGITAAASTIHAFVAVRARRRSSSRCELLQSAEISTSTDSIPADKNKDAAAERIEALRRRRAPEPTSAPRFEYHEGDGLTKIR